MRPYCRAPAALRRRAPADARGLADAIQRLLRDPARRTAMGAAGARRIEDHFSWRACAAHTAGLYEDVLARR